jgi:hypothetical protein
MFASLGKILGRNSMRNQRAASPIQRQDRVVFDDVTDLRNERVGTLAIHGDDRFRHGSEPSAVRSEAITSDRFALRRVVVPAVAGGLTISSPWMKTGRGGDLGTCVSSDKAEKPLRLNSA